MFIAIAPLISIVIHKLIKYILKEGFKIKVITLANLCSICTMQRICLKLELPKLNNITTTTAYVGRCSYITPAI